MNHNDDVNINESNLKCKSDYKGLQPSPFLYIVKMYALYNPFTFSNLKKHDIHDPTVPNPTVEYNYSEIVACGNETSKANVGDLVMLHNYAHPEAISVPDNDKDFHKQMEAIDTMFPVQPIRKEKLVTNTQGKIKDVVPTVVRDNASSINDLPPIEINTFAIISEGDICVTYTKELANKIKKDIVPTGTKTTLTTNIIAKA